MPPWAQDEPPVDLGTPFTLGAGEAIDLDGGRLTIGYDHLVSDSRCPPNVRCVWQGEARVALWAEGTRGLSRFELSTHSPRTAVIDGYEVELRNVWPVPHGTMRPASDWETLIEIVVRR